MSNSNPLISPVDQIVISIDNMTNKMDVKCTRELPLQSIGVIFAQAFLALAQAAAGAKPLALNPDSNPPAKKN